tara:strand:- start:197 stop:829 length:633 start_codon:yes stop_codon:yes gene_type:complete
MSDILKMHKLRDDCPVMVAKIPSPIRKEIGEWVNESRRIKNHSLSELRAHENVGYLSSDGKKHNSYQTSISPYLIEKSFWLAWVLRLTAKYWGMGGSHRDFSLRKWDGHFDSYDIWTNFAYKGDDNPTHNHAGLVSGVIYHKNHGHPTMFNDYDIAYEGKDGTMVMFPASTWHQVEPQTTNKERITLAFNIIRGQSKFLHEQIVDKNDAS